MITLEKNNVYTINYVKVNGEQITRDVLVLNEIPKIINGFDITGLSENDVTLVVDQMQEYKNYVDTYLGKMFKFEDWYEHSTGQPFPKNLLNYKKFIVENISEIIKADK